MTPAPQTGAASAQDVSSCSRGVLVTWDAATFGPEGGAYNVYGSDLSCADALTRAPLVTGLRRTEWLDRGSPGFGVVRHYVVEAESSGPGGATCAPAGGDHGGMAARACADPPVADDGGTEFPDVVGAILRARHAGQAVTMDWTRARALLPGEHFHLKKAVADPRTTFTRINPEGDLAREWTETDVSARLQFFELRVANACEDESIDEFPPGWDVPR